MQHSPAQCHAAPATNSRPFFTSQLPLTLAAVVSECVRPMQKGEIPNKHVLSSATPVSYDANSFSRFVQAYERLRRATQSLPPRTNPPIIR